MDLAELRDQLAFSLNHNDGQTDQDFSDARLNDNINWAYRREVRGAKLEGVRSYFTKNDSFTWAADAVTQTLPLNLRRKQIVVFKDITSNDPGQKLTVSADGARGGVHWVDNNTLQWGTSGPGATKTIRAFYLADAEKLTDDADEPELIPEEMHELIVWSAAVYLRTVADEFAPPGWLAALTEARMDYHKYVSRGRPYDDEPWIRYRDGDLDEDAVV